MVAVILLDPILKMTCGPSTSSTLSVLSSQPAFKKMADLRPSQCINIVLNKFFQLFANRLSANARRVSPTHRLNDFFNPS